jgi:cytochrome c oxidase subunit 2
VPSRSAWRKRAVLVLLAVAALSLPACGSGSPSTLDPKGPGASRIAGLWWFMLWVSAAVVVVVTVLLIVGILPRRGSRSLSDEAPRWAGGMVLLGGVVIPVIVLAILWALTLHDISALSQPSRPARLTVDVIGHQWWWEVRYPAQRIVTANDIHIPAGQPVQIRLSSIDVNHSFWVPQLTGKTDLIPGRTNTMWIQADRPGVYRGQCAEYCGVQHANMIFYVVADSAATFRRWVVTERRVPPVPTDPLLARGRVVFETSACAGCHTIQGTTATGVFGPNLTHIGGRLSIGAGTVPNTRDNLGGWIIDAQSIKPGSRMPPVQLDPKELQALIAYLESLK